MRAALRRTANLDDVVRQWSNKKRGDTPRQYLSSVTPFRTWLSPRDVLDAQSEDIRRYFRVARLSRWSQRRVLTALRSLYAELRSRRLRMDDPTSSVAVPRPRFAVSGRYRTTVCAAGPNARWADIVSKAFASRDETGAPFLELLRATFPGRDPLPMIYRRRSERVTPSVDGRSSSEGRGRG